MIISFREFSESKMEKLKRICGKHKKENPIVIRRIKR